MDAGCKPRWILRLPLQNVCQPEDRADVTGKRASHRVGGAMCGLGWGHLTDPFRKAASLCLPFWLWSFPCAVQVKMQVPLTHRRG